MSHHPPCDYDRTISIAGIRGCSRCFGMLIGAILGYCVFHYRCFPLDGFSLLIGTGLLTLPAAADFTWHEITSRYKSTNARRIVTGGIFGLPLGGLFCLAVHGRILPLFIAGLYLLTLQFGIAALFRFYGHLEAYIARYERAIKLDN